MLVQTGDQKREGRGREWSLNRPRLAVDMANIGLCNPAGAGKRGGGGEEEGNWRYF